MRVFWQIAQACEARHLQACRRGQVRVSAYNRHVTCDIGATLPMCVTLLVLAVAVTFVIWVFLSTRPDIANHFGSCADKHEKDWHVNSRESERALWFICEGGIGMEAVARLF